MSFFNGIDTSASGLAAQRVRLDVISQNIANANTTRTAKGTPYRRKMVLFKEKQGSLSFEHYLSENQRKFAEVNGVKVEGIVEDQRALNKVYNPSHPDADAEGYVDMPNVNIVEEMVDMISATRAYEANVTAMNASKSMAMKALDIGK